MFAHFLITFFGRPHSWQWTTTSCRQFFILSWA